MHFGKEILASRILLLTSVLAFLIRPWMNNGDKVFVLDKEIVAGVVAHRADAGLGALLSLGFRDGSFLKFIILLLDDLGCDLDDGSQFVLPAGVDVARGEPRERGDNGDQRDAEQNDNSQEPRANRSEEMGMVSVYGNDRHREQPFANDPDYHAGG